MYKSGSSVLETRPPSSCSGVVTDMGEFQHAERAAGTALLALLLLTGVDGLLCPLPDPGSAPVEDITQYVSLCAMCSHNEGAVRWSRFVDKGLLYYRNFYIRYYCTDVSGEQVIPEETTDDDSDDCPWIGTVYPLRDDEPSFGIYSIGRELSNGTRCEFILTYRIQFVGNGNARYHQEKASCTVNTGCVGEQCGIDQVCTFSNGTQGAEEGLCTECSCIDGYSGPACANIDECSGSNVCDGNADCHDTDGSYWCECRPGFQGDGYNCTDIDECLNVTCSGENSECVNTEGNYSCQCEPGFTGDGYNCTDIDECLSEDNICQRNSYCENSHGSYTCECNTGFFKDGEICTDVDECVTGNNTCSEYANCGNVQSSYECRCLPGFTGNGRNCTDIDECDINGLCENEPHTVCRNELGNYTCECKDDYYRDSAGNCEEGTDVVVVVVLVSSVLVLIAIAIVFSILLCIRMLRPTAIVFDELTIKEIDPFYSPKFLAGSLVSIHSEYESLYDWKPSCSTSNLEKVLEKGSTAGDEVVPVVSVVTDISSQEDSEKCESLSLGEESLERDHSHQSSCVSGNDNSDPYVDERSLTVGAFTARTENLHTQNTLNTSDDSTVSSGSLARGEGGVCLTKNSVSSRELGDGPPQSGYVAELKSGGFASCELRHSTVSQPEREEEEEDTDNKDSSHCALNIVCSENDGDCHSSGGVYVNYDSTHTDCLFSIGDVLDYTGFDGASFPLPDPNYVSDTDTLCVVH